MDLHFNHADGMGGKTRMVIIKIESIRLYESMFFARAPRVDTGLLGALLSFLYNL